MRNAAGKICKGVSYSWKTMWRANGITLLLYLPIDMVQSLCPLAQVYILNLLIDSVIAYNKTIFGSESGGMGMGNVDRSLVLAAAWMATVLLGHLLRALRDYIKGRLDAMSSRYFDEMIMDRMAKLPLSFLDTSEGRDLCDYANCCGGIICGDLFFGLMSAVRSLYTFGISVAVCVRWNYIFAGVYLLCTVPGIILDYIFYEKRDEFRRGTAADQRKMNYYRWMLVDSWPAKDVRMYDLTDDIRERYEEERKQYNSRKKKLDKAYLRDGLAWELLRRAGEVLVIGGILYDAYGGRISIGNIELYVGYALIAADAFSDAVSKFLGYVKGDCETVMPRFFQFMEAECPEEREGIRKPEGFLSLEFRDVFFKYPLAETYVLRGASFRLDAGEKLSLVGVNGAGKTTVIKLMLGFYEAESGQILLNGHPLEEYSLSDIRSLFSVLFQNYVQYPLSLRENVALSDLSRMREDSAVEEGLRKGGIYPDIAPRCKKGLDSAMTRQFDDEGLELSKGQWQKVALARTYFREAPVVVFDEPSAALDAEAEEKVFRSFQEVSGDRTGIMISHRISSARTADRIIVLEDGKVTESGTHEELAASDGLYARLYHLQKEKYTSRTGIAEEGRASES